MAESEEELKGRLMKVKQGSGKAGLKLNIQKTKIMAYSPITSWKIDGETVETVTAFIFLGFKITSLSLHRTEVSYGLALDQSLAYGNIVTGLIFCLEH